MNGVRFESLAIRADANLPDGEFRGTATLAKPGVYQYSDGVNTWTEWTPADALTDAEYMDGLRMLPVTLEHPPGNVLPRKGLAKSGLQVGALGDSIAADRDAMLAAPIAVHDADAARAARTTHQQISLAYQAIIDPNPGVTPDGVSYDRKQVKRRADHVALVPMGRHGPRIRVRADGTSETVPDTDGSAYRIDAADKLPPPFPKLTDRSAPTETRNMATIKLGNMTLEVADAATATAIQTHVDGLASQVETLTNARGDADTAKGALAAAKAEVETLKAAHTAELTQVRADADKTARARVALETKIAGLCGAEWKADGKSDRDCMVDGLKALKVEVAADASDDYLRGALEFAANNAPTRKTTAQLVADGMNRGDAKPHGNAVPLTADNLSW